MLSFDTLTPTGFEEFCYDLLRSLEFTNLNWRKGTALESSPADQGRDIEGILLKRDVDNQLIEEKWAVECKHYKQGVSPDKIQSAIAWAVAERPDVLLIIASGFLSNPTKNYLRDYEAKNRPPFRIKVWEAKQLDDMTVAAMSLRKKYGLPTELPFLNTINRYHLTYVTKPQLNKIESLLSKMDSLEAEIRDRAFAFTYHDIIRPRFRPPMSDEDTVGDMMIDKVDYDAFRSRCLALSMQEGFGFVHRTVSSALSWMFNAGDKSALGTFTRNFKWMQEYASREAETATSAFAKKTALDVAEDARQKILKLPEQMDAAYEDYTYVCEHLIRQLLSESESP
jgi:hypothetical protein